MPIGRAVLEKPGLVPNAPGDSYHPEPYLYVAPWEAERPGDVAYWNAPFGSCSAGTIC